LVDGVGENEAAFLLVDCSATYCVCAETVTSYFFFGDHAAIPHEIARADKSEVAPFACGTGESK